MSTLKKLVLIFAVTCCNLIVRASNGENGQIKKQDGCVHGYIMDAQTRKPVTGVTISASSSTSPVGTEISSDAAGYFHFAKLPVGEVTLMFEKKGYKLFKKEILCEREGCLSKMAVNIQPLIEAGFDVRWHPLLKLIE